MELPRSLRALRKPVPAPLRHVARAGLRQYGVATADFRPPPEFLVIGAKKAGTSSLMNWLVRHPAVMRTFPAIQRVKSPHYFDINYWRGQRWYRSHFPTTTRRRLRARRFGARPITGEASPYYMFHPAVPDRVAQSLPDVRIIALLRDPVTRAYSNYWDRRENGTEDLASFEEALDAEPKRLAGVDEARLLEDPRYYSFDHDNHTYLARGRYVEHLGAWLDLFPPDRLLILRAESLFTDPAQTFGLVQEFLQIPVVGSIPLRRYNERKHPPMSDDVRARLADYYRPFNAELYARLGTDLGWEDKYPG